MSGYPQGEVLLARCRAGRGKIVIVEGETLDDDPYFYGRWFGDRARDLSFVPQNGCSRVVSAVADLRAKLGPGYEVYGIRDRDFCDDSVLAAQDLAMPADGVLRPRRYTLENYLLDPGGWFEVVKMVSRSTLRPHWDSLAAVEAQVLAAYRACLPVAAWNYTVKQEYTRLPEDAGAGSLGYKAHPEAVRGDPCAALDDWGAKRGVAGSLGAAFTAELARLEAGELAQWQACVTGKAVLKVFLQDFPVTNAKALLVNLYLGVHPAPPEDLELLVRRIVSGAAVV